MNYIITYYRKKIMRKKAQRKIEVNRLKHKSERGNHREIIFIKNLFVKDL